jgi:hypothetical protein
MAVPAPSVLDELVADVRRRSREPYTGPTDNCNRTCQLYRLTYAALTERHGDGQDPNKQEPTWDVYRPYLEPLRAVQGEKLGKRIIQGIGTVRHDYSLEADQHALVQARRYEEASDNTRAALARVLRTELVAYVVELLKKEEAGAAR